MPELLIIGGSDAGISAALRIRELDPKAEVTVITADAYPNFSICGLPFYLSGEVADWRQLAHRTAAEIEAHGVRLLLNHRALAIDAESRSLVLLTPGGSERTIHYHRLLIATGAVSAEPSIKGIDNAGVFFLRWMEDAFRLDHYLREHEPQKAVIIGAGYIGLEMADALTRRGLQVVLVEYFPEVLPTLDPELGRLVRTELEENGVQVFTGQPVEAVDRKGTELIVRTASVSPVSADLVLVAAGARPETALAQSAAVRLGSAGAIRVDRRMRTSLPGIFAAGDCVETWHRLLEKNVYMPLGTTAHKQGRIAGENMIGGDRLFQGTMGTQVIKVFDRVAARSGLRDEEAKSAGFHPLTVEIHPWDHKAYYPDARPMAIRITGDRSSRRLLGAQIVAHHQSQAAKGTDILATAIYHRMRVDELCDLDLCYTPPLSSPWDPVQMAAIHWESQNRVASR